ncbi:SDR family oxidoreductase [Brevibacterium aurantiacum]|uniref:SDR family oxidoreductase n=1 Tax=Brevibacterium aurantiacum TaxID=273384 RepID=UPI001866663B|nr:SDR family oxidoreductase [Brevibacterium aurantiacum]
MGKLDGKVAVITGASGSIGKASCEVFAREGATVVGVDVREGDTVVDHFFACDLTDEPAVKNMYSDIVETTGKIDILFNNAGIAVSEDQSVLDTEMTVWQQVIDVNLTSVFLCCKYGIPHLIENGGGSVVNTASLVATVGSAASQIAYTASKGGVLAMSRELGVELAKKNIRVNAVSPGPVETPLLAGLFDQEEKERRLVHVPRGRFGAPHEIAEAVAFLASDAASYINATDFKVDGGIHSAYVTALEG